jgi:hypothetical protein
METISSATSENIKIFLVGNKSDLVNENEDNRKVSKEISRMYVDKYQNVIKNMECSAKYKSNLIQPFEELCKGCLSYYFNLLFFILIYFFIFLIEIYLKQKDFIKEKNEMRKKLLKSKIEKKNFFCC